MRTKIGLLIGLGTALLLFLSTYSISSVYGQQTDLKDSSIDNKTGNSNSGSQTDLDPFMSRGSDGNTNTGNGDDASLTDDGSTTKDDDGSGSTTKDDDGSGSTTKDDDSDSSKSSEQDKDSKSDERGKKFELPFP
jgi:hypothetical protein